MPDLSHLRRDFPVLRREIHGKRLVYLDSAATSQKPAQVLEAMDGFYRTSYANVHRGAYTLSEEATTAYEDARAKVAGLINAGSPAEVVFARGATSALNTVAAGWGADRLGPGDAILLTIMEHHSNLVPWQLVARRTGAELRYAPITGDFRLDMDALEAAIDDSVKVVSVTGMSNVLGTIPPVRRIAELAHRAGALCVVDAAQLVPHHPVDDQELDVDFLAFSGHKMLGPSGIGVLWGRRERLEEMEPFEGGGEMISDVRLDSSTWAAVPHKFEAGTPPVAEAIGLGAAVDYLQKVGMATVAAHDSEITAYALGRLAEIPSVAVYGPAETTARGGAVSFTMADIHPHDLATILDEEGVAIRAGHHCTKPLMRHLGLPATARVSFSVYNHTDDVDVLVAALRRAGELFGVG